VASTITRPMTFEEFEKLPNPANGHNELHHGETVFVAPPKHRHHFIRRRLFRLLDRAAGDAGAVSMEMGFRPQPEHEYWVADVIFVAQDRWKSIPWDGDLTGSPELVIEVLSPSNKFAEIRDKRKMCLETGSREFRVVDIDLHEVEVSTTDGHSVTYTSGQSIPLFFGGNLAVDEIFG